MSVPRALLQWLKRRRTFTVIPDTVPPPQVFSVSPDSVDTAGNVSVTVTGAGFLYPVVGAAMYQVETILFDGVAATNLVVISATSLTCTVPAHAAGAVNVRAVGPGGYGFRHDALTYEDPMDCCIAGTCSLEQFGAVGDGVTSDQTAFAAAVAALNAGTYSAIILGAKTYLVSGATITHANVTILGEGAASCLKTTSDASVITVGAVEGVSFAGFRILGSGSGSSQHGINVGVEGSGSSAPEKMFLSHLFFDSLGARGYSYAENPISNHLGPRLSDCLAKGCGTGFYFGTRGEYASATNCSAVGCTTGVYDSSGNLNWTGGDITNNTTGVSLQTGTNDSHGTFTGVQINHNATYGIDASGIQYGFAFTGCNIFENPIRLVNSNGVRFVGGQVDVSAYTNTSSTNILFDCIFGNVYGLTITEDTNAQTDFSERCKNVAGQYISAVASRRIKRYTFPSDADVVPSKQDSIADTIIVLNGTTTTTRKITLNGRAPTGGNVINVRNQNTYDVQIAWSTGNPVTIPSGKQARIGEDGTNAVILLQGITGIDGGFVYDTFANRPSAPNRGTMFVPSDAPGKFFFNGTIWQPDLYQIRGVEPLSTAPTVYSAGGRTTTFLKQYGALELSYADGTTGEDARVAVWSIAGETTFIYHFRLNIDPVNTQMAGVAFRQSSNGSIELFVARANGSGASFARHRATANNTTQSPTYSFSAEATYDVAFLHSTGIWLKTVISGGNRVHYASSDGHSYVLLFSSTDSDHITANEYGIGIFSSTSGPKAQKLVCDSLSAA